MWLLNTSSLQLEHISNARTSTIRYAVLSHTWNEDEVTFQDMQTGHAQNRKGWHKVHRTALQAAADDLAYAWVDTCCINKESSAELTEAINSMWRWYSEAQVCYVFLSDLSGDCPEIEDANDDNGDCAEQYAGPWHELLASCRWFTRGWCLQELLAPSSLIFYSSSWRRVGTKHGLLFTLWQIIGIDPTALADKASLSDFVVARKMSWAAARQTERVEDRAYSLMGMFGVNMPLLYGEGDKAFLRLQEEIIKTSTDHSIFAWEAPHGVSQCPQESVVNYSLFGPTVDLVFARSPDQFVSGRRMEQWQSEFVDRPFDLNNRGIHFDALFTVSDEKGTYAVLNCRYEDDIRGPLALRLSQVDGPTSNYDIEQLITKNDFWVQYPGEGGNRVVVLEDSPENEVSDQNLTLLRYHPLFRFAPAREHLRMPKFVIIRGGSLDGSQLLDAYPRARWNLQTGVLCPLAHRERRTDSLIRGSALISLKSGIHLAVAFAAQPWSHPERVTTEPVQQHFKLTLAETDQQTCRRNVLDLEPPTTAIVRCSDGMYCRAQATIRDSADLGCLLYSISITSISESDPLFNGIA